MKKFLNKIEKATGIDIDGDGKVRSADVSLLWQLSPLVSNHVALAVPPC